MLVRISWKEDAEINKQKEDFFIGNLYYREALELGKNISNNLDD